jgi:hypothetical protein
MSPAAMALLAGGGAAGLGSLAYVLAQRRRRARRGEKQGTADLVYNAMLSVALKKAGDLHRKQAADLLCRHLDHQAQRLPLEKTAQIRTLQREIINGKPLSLAIKTAYPQLPGEQRGLLASRLVRAALSWQGKQAAQAKQAAQGKKGNADCGPTASSVATTEPSSYTGPVSSGLSHMRSSVGY